MAKKFYASVPKGCHICQVLTSAVMLWLDLPEDRRAATVLDYAERLSQEQEPDDKETPKN